MRKRVCDWFNREGAIRFERGEDLDSHLDQCAACREAHDEYIGMVALLPLAHAESTDQARDLARRVRLAIAAALAALLCFFTGRRAALAAPGGWHAAPMGPLLASCIAVGLALGTCGLLQQDHVARTPSASSMQSGPALEIVEAPSAATTSQATPVSPAPAVTERPAPRAAAVAVREAIAPASRRIPSRPRFATSPAARSVQDQIDSASESSAKAALGNSATLSGGSMVRSLIFHGLGADFRTVYPKLLQ